MKVLCVIPSRYQSSRLPGKPLVDICGKPMIWWTYQRVKQIKCLEIIVATDDAKIMNVCKSYNIPCIMTGDHPTHIHRIAEVSNIIYADWYLCVCGDEPIIESNIIESIIPKHTNSDEPEVFTLNRVIKNPSELIDPGNIKATINDKSEIIELSRAAIPFPYKTVNFNYHKTIGIECFNKKALDFYINSEKGNLEKIEDIALLRFLENRIKVNTIEVKSNSLSVDTERDLEVVRNIIYKEINDL